MPIPPITVADVKQTALNYLHGAFNGGYTEIAVLQAAVTFVLSVK